MLQTVKSFMFHRLKRYQTALKTVPSSQFIHAQHSCAAAGSCSDGERYTKASLLYDRVDFKRVWGALVSTAKVRERRCVQRYVEGGEEGWRGHLRLQHYQVQVRRRLGAPPRGRPQSGNLVMDHPPSSAETVRSECRAPPQCREEAPPSSDTGGAYPGSSSAPC